MFRFGEPEEDGTTPIAINFYGIITLEEKLKALSLLVDPNVVKSFAQAVISKHDEGIEAKHEDIICRRIENDTLEFSKFKDGSFQSLIQYWINKCVFCEHAAACLYMLLDAHNIDWGDKIKISKESISKFMYILRGKYKHNNIYSEDINKILGMMLEDIDTDEALKTLQKTLTWCQEKNNCMHDFKLKKWEDIHEIMIGNCSDCPARLVMFRKFVSDLLKMDERDVILMILEMIDNFIGDD